MAKAVLLFCHCLTDSQVSEIEPLQISSRPACWLPLTLAGKTANDPWLSALPTLLLYVFMVPSDLQDCVESFWHQTRCSLIY